MSKETKEVEEKKVSLLGMTVRHYSSLFSAPLYHHMTDDFGKSNTDTSKWRPDISLIHSQSLGKSGLTPVYDFPDGKDNPDSWTTTFIRSKGLDVTEVDKAIEVQQSYMDAKKKSSEKTSDDVMRENIQKLADKMASDAENPTAPASE